LSLLITDFACPLAPSIGVYIKYMRTPSLTNDHNLTIMEDGRTIFSKNIHPMNFVIINAKMIKHRTDMTAQCRCFRREGGGVPHSL